MKDTIRFDTDEWQYFAEDEHRKADVNWHVIAAGTIVVALQDTTYFIKINHFFIS